MRVTGQGLWRLLGRMAAGVGGVCLCLVLLATVMHLRGVRGAAIAAAEPMSGHMAMTAARPLREGDRERADAVLAAARRVAGEYGDYHKALADGYEIFLPGVEQKVYHFTRNRSAVAAQFRFDPEKPTSLLYEKERAAGEEPGYKLVGVMYTAPYRASEDELDRRVPLSVARWHVHTNLCLPPNGTTVDWKGPEAKFGLGGSITTEEACKAAGGKFMPHLFGWMVHVYPLETDAAKIWSAEMNDEHGMEHQPMPGMKM